MKRRRRNPSQELDRALRRADKQPAWPYDCSEDPKPPEKIGERVDRWLSMRREAIIEVARMLMEASWVTPSMQRSKKSPYLPTVVQWYLNRSIRLPEDVPKTQETLLEFHQMMQAGILKGDNADIEFQTTQQKLAKFLRAFKAGAKKGGLYEQEGCVRAGEYGPYVLFRVDDYETGKVVFDGTNWCVRNKPYFDRYHPPFWMVINTGLKQDEEDRVCLMHANSFQVKSIDDDPLDKMQQRMLLPFLEFVFGKWACKYNMSDQDGSDLQVGEKWWPFQTTVPFGAVQEIIDVIYGIGDEISKFSDEASMQCQDRVEDDLKENEYDEDEDGDYDEWIEKMRETEKYNKLLGMEEDAYIESSDSRLDKEAYDLVGGLVFDASVALDVACPNIFGVSWDKLRKSLNIRPQVETRHKNGKSHDVQVGFYVRGNSRFNRETSTPKMERWAERSIDRFLARIPDEKDFRRYLGRRNGAGLWKPLYAADRIAEGYR